MSTNKERIENLEASFGDLQNKFDRMEAGVGDKLRQIEAAISRMSDNLITRHETSLGSPNAQAAQSSNGQDQLEGRRPMFTSKLAKLEFPRYSGDDPTEWFTRVGQFFEYQNTSKTHKVSLASFHLEGEANQWWQWLRRAYHEEGKVVTWGIFVEELWSRFGPTDCEDFDEALSKIEQKGSLRDYQKEFERLGNKVSGWTQKALVGTFMGGLEPEIAEGIRMFKPKTLKEAISLARMMDDHLSRQKKTVPMSSTTSSIINSSSTMKRLSWEEMQKRRTQGLCFNCDEKFTPGHKCKGPQLLVLDGVQEDQGEIDAVSGNYITYSAT